MEYLQRYILVHLKSLIQQRDDFRSETVEKNKKKTEKVKSLAFQNSFTYFNSIAATPALQIYSSNIIIKIHLFSK